MLQRTDEWLTARLGRVTASRIADVVARTRNGWGASRMNYRAELITERLTGQPASRYMTQEMRWGIDTEADAIAAFEFYTDLTVEPVGFVEHPTIEMAGASPDGLIGEEGLIEVKCPNSATHIDTLLGAPIPGRYVLQMQWQMACTGRKWCKWVSFDPRLPERMQLHIVHVERDDKKIAELEHAVRVFLREIETILAELRARYEEAA